MPIINTKKDTVAGTITVGSRPLNARHPQHLILSTSSSAPHRESKSASRPRCRSELSVYKRDNRRMPSEPPHPPRPAPKPPRMHVTPEDIERFGDEEQVREVWDEGRLRDEQPPHHL